MEQELIEDLVIESIRIYGVDTWYMPRTIGAKDELLNEDDLPIFDDAWLVEMYIKNVDGFEGEGDFLSKFGLQIRDSMTLTVAIRTFDAEVGAHSEQVRPNEGDIIYFPLNQKFFKVMHVEHESIFYQMGSLQTYDLRCELFEFSGERFQTGQDFIDDAFDDINIFTSEVQTVYSVSIVNDKIAIIEDGDHGAPEVEPYFELKVGEPVTFDLSDGSNFEKAINFYPDELEVTPIDDNVTYLGTAGFENSYALWTPSAVGEYYYSYSQSHPGVRFKVVGQTIEDYDRLADNITIESEGDNILDFTQDNPFGDEDF